MPFVSSTFLADTDLTNILRGAARQNFDSALLLSNTAETQAQLVLPGGVLGSPGLLYVEAAGTCKATLSHTTTLTLKLGGTTLFSNNVFQAAATTEWLLKGWITAVTSSSQVSSFFLSTNSSGAPGFLGTQTCRANVTSSVNMTVDPILAITGTCVNLPDTAQFVISTFQVHIAQIQG